MAHSVNPERAAQQAAAAWARILAAPCDHAPPGLPCFDLPTGLCGRRIRRAGYPPARKAA